MATFISSSSRYTIYLEEKEELLAGNRIKRHLRKVQFERGLFETKDEKLIEELRKVEGYNRPHHFSEVKDAPGQAAGANVPKK